MSREQQQRQQNLLLFLLFVFSKRSELEQQTHFVAVENARTCFGQLMKQIPPQNSLNTLYKHITNERI
jgi:hypothetical protein